MQNDIVIEKMIGIIEKIQSYVGQCDYESFCGNEMLIDACVFNLGQLGEVSNKISESFEESHPQIPWRQIYGLRNRVIHDYEGINLRLIWEIINDDLPSLYQQLIDL